MKLSTSIVIVTSLLNNQAIASTLLFEEFEDLSSFYTTSIPEFSDGSNDFFTRSNGTNHSANISYTNIQGTSYFTAMDINGEGATLPVTMDFNSIYITDFAYLSFSGFFAEDDDGTNQDWDLND